MVNDREASPAKACQRHGYQPVDWYDAASHCDICGEERKDNKCPECIKVFGPPLPHSELARNVPIDGPFMQY